MHKYISEIEVGSIERVELLFLSADKKTSKNGKDFSVLNLSDGKTTFEAKHWDSTPENLGITPGTIISADLKVSIYNDKLDYQTTGEEPYVGSEVTLKEFVIMPQYDIDEMYNYIVSTLRREADNASLISYSDDGFNEPIANIALSLIEGNAEKFKKSTAAVSMHHNLYGGLILHTYEMMMAAEGMLKAFPYLDSELLLSAIAIHDIGKIYTYTTGNLGESDINSLEVLDGHLAIGYAAVMKETRKHKCLPERVHLLEHMVAAHHGKKEWGAIVSPATPEAFLVFAIDYLDSRLYMYRKAQESVEPGSYTGKQFALDNTNVYRPTYLKKLQ